MFSLALSQKCREGGLSTCQCCDGRIRMKPLKTAFKHCKHSRYPNYKILFRVCVCKQSLFFWTGIIFKKPAKGIWAFPLWHFILHNYILLKSTATTSKQIHWQGIGKFVAWIGGLLMHKKLIVAFRKTARKRENSGVIHTMSLTVASGESCLTMPAYLKLSIWLL